MNDCNRGDAVAEPAFGPVPRCLIAGALACTSLVPRPSHGDAMESIVVTAQKRAEDVRDVAIAVTALPAAEIEALDLRNAVELERHVPGLTVTDLSGSTTTVFTLRGSSQLDFADHQEAPVAVFLDGAYNSFLGGVGQSFYDLERIEVLKGPQGTVFGRNATAGVVQVVSRRPRREADAYADVGYGEYDNLRVEAAAGGPLGERVAGRVSALYESHDGFIERLGPGGDLSALESRNLRGQLLVDLDARTTLHLQGRWNDEDDANTLGYHATPVTLDFPAFTGAELFAITNGVSALFGVPNDAAFVVPAVGRGDGLVRESAGGGNAGYAAFCAHPLGVGVLAPPPAGAVDCFGNVEDDDPRTARVNEPGNFDRQYWGATVTLEHSSGPWRLVDIADYQSLDKRYLEDTDGTPLASFAFFQGADAWQASNEFRVHYDGGNVRWVAGAYYLHVEGDYRTGLDLAAGLGFAIDNRYRNETDTWAVFAQGDWTFRPGWTLTAGLRWTEDYKEASLAPACRWAAFDPDCTAVLLPFLGFAGNSAQQLGYDLDREEGDYSMRVALGWEPTDDWLLFASVNRGTKAGGFNAGATALYTLAQSEFDGEVLWSWEGGSKLTLFGGAAQLDATVFRYDYSDFQTFTMFGPSLVVFNVDADVTGAEVELLTRPVSGLELRLGASVLDAEIRDLAFGAGIVADAPMTNAPDLTLNGVARYEWRLPAGFLTAQIDFAWTDERNLNAVPHPAYVADAYVTANARLGFRTPDGRWTAELWVRNLGDESYTPAVFDLATFTGSRVATVGAPRRFGATLRYAWAR